MADILKPGWKRSQATIPGTKAYTDPSGRRVVHQYDYPNTVPVLSRQGLRQYVADPLRSMAGTPTLADLGYFPRGLRRPSMNPALAENQRMPNVAAPSAVATPNMSALSAPGALRTAEFRVGRDDTPLNGSMLQNLPAAIVPGTPNPNTYLQNAGGLASDEKVAGYLDDFRTSELARRDAKASSLQRYNQRLADENSAGRLNASRNTYYGGDFPMSGGSAVAPYGAVAGAVRQGGMSGLPPEGYFQNALIEVPPERVAPEMQQFVNDQNRFNSATGQSLPNNQEGLTPGNPWFDNTPRPRGPANAYGLSRMPQPAQQLATPEQAAGMRNGRIAQYGDSTLQRVNGRNVLVGGNSAIVNGDVRGAIRKAQDAYTKQNDDGSYQDPRYGALMKYKREKGDERRARDSALRTAALNRRLMQMGSPPMNPKGGTGAPGSNPYFGSGTPRSPLANPPKTGNPTVDKANEDIARDEARTRLKDNPTVHSTYKKIGLDTRGDLSGVQANYVLGALDNVQDANMTEDEKAVIQASVSDYIKVNPKKSFSVPEHYDEMEAIASGNFNKAAALRKKRQEDAKKAAERANDLSTSRF